MPLTAFGTVRLDQSRFAEDHKTRVLRKTRVRNPQNRDEVFTRASDIEEVAASFQTPDEYAEGRERLLSVARGLSQRRLRRMQIAAGALNNEYKWVEDEEAVRAYLAPRDTESERKWGASDRRFRAMELKIAQEIFAHFKPIRDGVDEICNERLPRRRLR